MQCLRYNTRPHAVFWQNPEIDNLYVVNARFSVSGSAVNPSLTIIANAIRVGEHILDRMK